MTTVLLKELKFPLESLGQFWMTECTDEAKDLIRQKLQKKYGADHFQTVEQALIKAHKTQSTNIVLSCDHGICDSCNGSAQKEQQKEQHEQDSQTCQSKYQRLLALLQACRSTVLDVVQAVAQKNRPGYIKLVPDSTDSAYDSINDIVQMAEFQPHCTKSYQMVYLTHPLVVSARNFTLHFCHNNHSSITFSIPGTQDFNGFLDENLDPKGALEDPSFQFQKFGPNWMFFYWNAKFHIQLFFQRMRRPTGSQLQFAYFWGIHSLRLFKNVTFGSRKRT
jgi:hypothetical protein